MHVLIVYNSISMVPKESGLEISEELILSLEASPHVKNGVYLK